MKMGLLLNKSQLLLVIFGYYTDDALKEAYYFDDATVQRYSTQDD